MSNSRCRIISAMNGKAITVSRGQRNTKYGHLIMEQYVESKDQMFHIQSVGENQYIIRTAGDNNKVFDVINESADIYKEIITYECHLKPNQKWRIIDMPNQNVLIQSVHSGLVLQIQGGIDADGMLLVQNKNYRNKSQMWRIERL